MIPKKMIITENIYREGFSLSKPLKLRDLGEKEIIKSIIKPLLNPKNELELAGDDCAVVRVTNEKSVCLSTDRVPSDLLSFKLGIIDYYGLGYYLAVLNISDICASGAIPVGLLLNFAFENDFLLDDFSELLNGAKKACDEYNCLILGGDLSNSKEMSISATSVGIGDNNKLLYRKGAKVGDYIYCTDNLGLTSTAFKYFLDAKPKGLMLTREEEETLENQFKKPRARLEISNVLSEFSHTVVCMDNTDGVGQTFIELSEINDLRFELDFSKLPIHSISYKVAEFLKTDILEIVLGSGADFQLLGTISSTVKPDEIMKNSDKIIIIGETSEGNGLWINNGIETKAYNISGWDYFNLDIDSIINKK